MKLNKMDWRAWLALIIIMTIISSIASGYAAHAEDAVPPDTQPTTESAPAPEEDSPVPDDALPPAEETSALPDPPTDTPDATPIDAPTEDPNVSPEASIETPELPPVDLKTLFDVSIKVPSGWRNTDSAAVRIKITPASEQLWHKVRYRIGDEDWETIKNSELVLYEGYYYTDIEVYYNAKMTVRLFGDEETYFDTNKEINIFDHYAPEVTAGFRDQVLHVEAVDDLAQVAGIQVNGLLFTTLVDGTLDVRITVQTRAGETYYMVIDYDKPIDEENEIYETYFLNLVDDRDLMSVVSEDEIVATPTPQIVYVTPEPAPATQQPAPIVVEDDGMEKMLPMILLIGSVAAIGGAIFWLVKKKKDSSARNVPDFDDEYEFEDDEESDE